VPSKFAEPLRRRVVPALTGGEAAGLHGALHEQVVQVRRRSLVGQEGLQHHPQQQERKHECNCVSSTTTLIR